MNESQTIFGEPKERTKGKVKPFMSEWIQDFIQNSPFLVMSTSDGAGNCDASPKGGQPGFVKVLNETQLVLPDVAGNKLFQSYENTESNPHIGLIFMIPGMNVTARVNGRLRVLRKGETDFDRLTLQVFNPDENAQLLQAMLIDVDEAYSHCPRAFAFSKLWDCETIQKNLDTPPIQLK